MTLGEVTRMLSDLREWQRKYLDEKSDSLAVICSNKEDELDSVIFKFHSKEYSKLPIHSLTLIIQSANMRAAQRKYRSTLNALDLFIAKGFERKVDRLLKTEPSAPIINANLFEQL